MADNGYAKPVLVTTDWLAEHLGDGARRRRSRREPGPLRRGAHPGRDQAALARRSAGPGRARPRREGRVRAAHGLARDLQRDDDRPLRRQEQLVRRVRVLVPQDLRPRGRAHPRRRTPEVDRREPRADDRRAAAAPASYSARDRDETIRARPRCGARRLAIGATRWSTCAPRRSTRAS